MLGEEYERLAPIVYAIIVAEDYNRPKFTRAIAELERRTGITRARLRRMKANGFKSVPHGLTGKKADATVLNGYTSTLDGVFCK